MIETSWKGACRILSVYWEMVPRDTISALLARVVGRLASDGSSPLVRLGAVEGLSLLLECPASHGALKAMLPVSPRSFQFMKFASERDWFLLARGC